MCGSELCDLENILLRNMVIMVKKLQKYPLGPSQPFFLFFWSPNSEISPPKNHYYGHLHEDVVNQVPISIFDQCYVFKYK